MQSFDQKLLVVAPQKPLAEKRKKEMFRSLVTDAIGVSVDSLLVA